MASIVEVLKEKIEGDGEGSLDLLYAIFMLGQMAFINGEAGREAASKGEAEFRKLGQKHGLAAVLVALKEAGALKADLT